MFATNSELVTLVELSVSGRNLRDKDVFSKSDPMCVVFQQPFGSIHWREVNRTECISNNLNPDFATKIQLDYRFEEQQKLRFEVYDIDSPSPYLKDHDFIGGEECTLANIVTSGTYELPLRDRAGMISGSLLISCEELSSLKDEVEIQIIGRKLDNKRHFFNKSSPFLTFLKVNEMGNFTVVHRTEVVKNSLNPSWKKFCIPVRSLCNCDHERQIKIECWDWRNNGHHKLIGDVCVNLKTIAGKPTSENIHYLGNSSKQRKNSSSNKYSGELHLIHCKVRPTYTFLDYVRGGIQLNCSIAVDFTASNGPPNQPNSLHYINMSHLNQYEQAIVSVGEIIEDYDTDKLFPVLGFGALLPPDGRVSHEFFVNMHATNPYCQRVGGVLEAYRHCITQIKLHGPTNFSPVINHVAKIASMQEIGKEYFILLIITDGIITDMPQTKQAIVNASYLPISIIIVGVGNADFSAMEELDGDTVRISFRGREAVRDIVQFVALRNFSGCVDAALIRARLAKEVLAEIPRQFINFMKEKGIVPNPPTYNPVALPPDPEKIIL